MGRHKLILTETKTCPICTRVYTRRRFGQRLETQSRFLQRVTCSTTCMGLWMEQNNPNPSRHAMSERARKRHLDSVCEACGSTIDLSIHHKNRDWADNRQENLATLCASCHTTLHHEAGDIKKASPPKPCLVCPTPSRKHGLCGLHAQRMRKHGDPLLTQIKVGGSWYLAIDTNAIGSASRTRTTSTRSATPSSPSSEGTLLLFSGTDWSGGEK